MTALLIGAARRCWLRLGINPAWPDEAPALGFEIMYRSRSASRRIGGVLTSKLIPKEGGATAQSFDRGMTNRFKRSPDLTGMSDIFSRQIAAAVKGNGYNNNRKASSFVRNDELKRSHVDALI